MAIINTKKLVICAMLTALTALATIVIQIPSPMSGYVNLGDAVVLFSAFILGPILGAISAGLGSALADILTGYVIYAPATLIIKATMAVVAYLIFIVIKKAFNKNLPALILGGIVAELIMVAGYFLYACLIMGEGIAAAASIPGNLVQGLIGVIIGTAISVFFVRKNPFDKSE